MESVGLKPVDNEARTDLASEAKDGIWWGLAALGAPDQGLADLEVVSRVLN